MLHSVSPLRAALLPPVASRDARSCSAVIALVAQEKNLPPHLLVHPSRCRRATARARQLAMYLSHVVMGHSLTEIARAFGRDRTTVSHACALIEDLRDDPGFDAEVSRYERRLEEAAGEAGGHGW
ncbi:helix-turn-helix domain-containing protein [Devosia aquimaris]|uniref:helix-turn-helix domain-containing protein n=1 Tax=Devosia aquimaris TaxID=2866214 RepID=UPI001CD11619|nr:helix-turn-helix domain-containing protein [Devosia sp. CJK-A8-3]